MDIEEIQATWAQMSNELEKQKKLTNQIILQMTQGRYSHKFRMITTIETIGALICFAVGLYILANIGKLDTWYLFSSGIFTLAFLLVMPILILRALQKIKNIDILRKNYRETLVSYTKAKKNLLKLQQFSIYASFFLMFTTAAVFSKIWSNKDFFVIDRDPIVYVALAIALIFMVFFTRWGYKGYMNITRSAEDIINELK